MVGQVGVEPTVFLMSRFYRPLQSPAMRTDPYWWNRLESDQRHPGLQPGALPAELQFHMAESAEFESDTISGTIRLAGGPRTFRVHSPYVAGAAGFEPTMPVSETGALTAWRRPNRMAGAE